MTEAKCGSAHSMFESADGEAHPADLPDPCARGFVDRMTEDICSQVHAEIQMGFADLSVKLISEIQKLSYQGARATSAPSCPWIAAPSQGSVQNKSVQSNKTPSNSRLEFDSVLANLVPAKKSRKTSERLSQNSGQNSRLVSVENSIKTTLSHMMHPWRSTVASDIELHNKSFRKYLDSIIVEMRNRALRDAAFPDNCLVRLVLGKFFTALSFLLITVNAIWMAYESDCQLGQPPGQQIKWHNTVSLVFTIWFVVELVLRIAALQKYFFFGSDFMWNMLDLVLVLVSIPEMFIHSVNLSYIRLIRVVRLSRAFRLIRLVKFFTSLREILLSLLYTLGSLFWSLVALALTTYIFALSFMQWFALQASEGVQLSNAVTESFRSTLNTMLILFSMISGGQEWYDMIAEFNHQADFVSKTALVFYIFFTMFGLLNVIVGVFVARALQSCNSDRQLRIAKEEAETAKKVKGLIQIFNEIDNDGNGHISPLEFKEYFEDRHSQYMLKSHGLQLFASEQMWQVMDHAYDGEGLDLPNFVMGMIRLSGDAKSTELVLLSKRVEEILVTVLVNQVKFDELLSELGVWRNSSADKETGYLSRAPTDMSLIGAGSGQRNKMDDECSVFSGSRSAPMEGSLWKFSL